MKLDIPFYRQTTPLNCGQAALKIVFSFFKQDVSIEELEKLSFLEKEKGTNTIQLVIAVASLGNKVEFYTKHAGFNKDNESLEFVRKYSSVKEEDADKLFSLAKSKGAKVYEQTMSLNDLKKKLNKDSVPIILVNWNIIIEKKEKGYQGHFITMNGYNEENVFIYNPDDETGKVLKIKNDLFDEARKAEGTDEDIIFIHRK